MNPSQTRYPAMKDLTMENITDNVQLINSGCENPRLKYLMERLVSHVHDFIRETRFNMEEWDTVINFLTETGQKCTSLRQEFILLSDVLGVSLIVDSISHPKPDDATEGTVLGPFHTDDAIEESNGDVISHDPDGTPMLCVGKVMDRAGKPIEGAIVDVWETDSKGFYDVQYDNRKGPDGRAVLHSDKDGMFWFKGIVPVSYPVPVDGPVGQLLSALRRHPYRPAHVHFMLAKKGFDTLITALTLKGDQYLEHDPVFGVKSSLIATLSEVTDEEDAKTYGVEKGTKLMTRDFVLVGTEEAAELRKERAIETMKGEGEVEFYEGLPYVKK